MYQLLCATASFTCAIFNLGSEGHTPILLKIGLYSFVSVAVVKFSTGFAKTKVGFGLVLVPFNQKAVVVRLN